MVQEVDGICSPKEHIFLIDRGGKIPYDKSEGQIKKLLNDITLCEKKVGNGDDPNKNTEKFRTVIIEILKTQLSKAGNNTADYNQYQLSSLYYALISLEISLENYANAKQLMIANPSAVNKTLGIKNAVNLDIREKYLRLETGADDLTPDKWMWLVNMALQLVEAGEINDKDGDPVLKMLNSAARFYYGNHYYNLDPLASFFNSAGKYVKYKVTENTDELRSLCKNTIIKKDGTVKNSNIQYLLGLRVLNDLLSIEEPLSADLTNAETVTKPFPQFPLNDFNDLAETSIRYNNKPIDRAVAQLRYDTYVQLFMLRANYLLKSGKFAELKQFLDSNACTLLKDREGSYFEQFISYLECEMIFGPLSTRIKIAGRDPVSQDLPAVEKELKEKIEELSKIKGKLYKDNLMLNRARRLLAQVKEMQGYYTKALDIMTEVDNSFLKKKKRIEEAKIYDDLQKAGLWIKLNKITGTEKLLAELPTKLKTAQKEIYYSRRITIAAMYKAEDKDEAKNKAKERLNALRENNKEQFFVAKANQCELNLALLDSDDPAGKNLKLAKEYIGKLPDKKQADYKSTEEQLGAYKAAELRTISTSEKKLFPVIDSQHSLTHIETRLVEHYCYLSVLADDTVLESIDASLGATQKALNENKNNEGLTKILNEYQARLYLLKYKFYAKHYARTDLNDVYVKAEKNFNNALSRVSDLKTVKALQKEFAELKTPIRPDIPAYTILEKKFAEKMNEVKFNGSFWKDKRKLDDLLDIAVAVRHLFAPAEIIKAVNELYALGLEDHFPEIKRTNSELTAKVTEFYQKNPEYKQGFKFTDAEKGYGYFLLLRLLNGTDQYEKIKKIISEKYDADKKYYPESSKLIFDYRRAHPKHPEVTLPELKDVQKEASGPREALNEMDKALTNNDLSRAISIAEKALKLESGMINSEYKKFTDFATRYKELLNAKEDENYTGYSAEKLLLELASTLIRKRSESGEIGIDKKIRQLLQFIDELSVPVNGEYFAMRRALLKVQYCTAMSVRQEKDSAWEISKLNDYTKELFATLEKRKKNAISANEKNFLDALTAARDGRQNELPENLILPDEAKYLYTEIAFRLPQAIITRAKTENRWLTEEEKNSIEATMTVLKKQDEKNNVIKYIEKDVDRDKKRIAFSMEIKYGQKTESFRSEWDYSVKNKDTGKITDVNGNYLDSKTTVDTYELLVSGEYKFSPSLTLFGILGGGLAKINNKEETLSQIISENRILPSAEGISKYVGSMAYPILGLGADWRFLRNRPIGFFTLTSANTGGEINYRWDPYLRSGKLIHGNNLSISGQADAWLAPNGWENFLQIGLKHKLTYSGKENFEPADEKERKFFEQNITNQTGLGFHFQYDKFSLNLMPNLAYRYDINNKKWILGYGADAGISYKDFNLYGGWTFLNKEAIAYLEAQYDINKDLLLFLTANYYSKQGADTSKAKFKSDAYTETTTNTRDQTGKTKGWWFGGGFKYPIDTSK